MVLNDKKKTGKPKASVSRSKHVSPDEIGDHGVVERVLEHISSPYRWELLEATQIQKKNILSAKKLYPEQGESDEKY